ARNCRGRTRSRTAGRRTTAADRPHIQAAPPPALPVVPAPSRPGPAESAGSSRPLRPSGRHNTQQPRGGHPGADFLLWTFWEALMNRDSIVRTSYAPDADLPVNTNWREDGACTREDPELFFPIGNTGPALLQIEEAKSVCRRCPVLERCA